MRKIKRRGRIREFISSRGTAKKRKPELTVERYSEDLRLARAGSVPLRNTDGACAQGKK